MAQAQAARADGRRQDDEVEHGVGTGVVIVDKGMILTNLHVVAGADTHQGDLLPTAWNPTPAITGVQPENDLAVLQAHKIPDDLIAATMRSTGDLRAGRQGGGGRLSVRHRPVGVGRRGLGPEARRSARPKASRK